MNGGDGASYMQIGRSGMPVSGCVPNEVVGCVVGTRRPKGSGEEHPIL